VTGRNENLCESTGTASRLAEGQGGGRELELRPILSGKQGDPIVTKHSIAGDDRQ